MNVSFLLIGPFLNSTVSLEASLEKILFVFIVLIKNISSFKDFGIFCFLFTLLNLFLNLIYGFNEVFYCINLRMLPIYIFCIVKSKDFGPILCDKFFVNKKALSWYIE